MYLDDKPNYNKDTVFDRTNISKYLSHHIYIPKTKPHLFIYHKDSNKYHPSTNQQEENIIKEINKNHFDIKIEEVKIRYPNDYTVFFTEWYTLWKYFGQGAFGWVISVLKKENRQKYAVKIIKKTRNERNSSILNEVKILKRFDNPRIMKLYDVIDTDDYWFLFMELIEGGSLKDFILNRYHKDHNEKLVTEGNDERMPSSDNASKSKISLTCFITDEEASIIIRGWLEGIDYMHRNNIMHRDIKPDNIMFKNINDWNSWVICDFGIADDISCGERNTNKCGTMLFMAPEMIWNKSYDQRIDIWACGIIMYILLSGGKHPLYSCDVDKEELINKIKGKGNWDFPEEFPNWPRNLFMKLCKKEPSDRIQTQKSLLHPWIQRTRDEIPWTVLESYEKIDKVKRFKTLLCCSLFFTIFKNVYKGMFTYKAILAEQQEVLTTIKKSKSNVANFLRGTARQSRKFFEKAILKQESVWSNPRRSSYPLKVNNMKIKLKTKQKSKPQILNFATPLIPYNHSLLKIKRNDSFTPLPHLHKPSTPKISHTRNNELKYWNNHNWNILTRSIFNDDADEKTNNIRRRAEYSTTKFNDNDEMMYKMSCNNIILSQAKKWLQTPKKTKNNLGHGPCNIKTFTSLKLGDRTKK